MATRSPPHAYAWFAWMPHAVAAISVAVGALVLIGWTLGVETLKSVLPGLTIMKANTATGFILSGVSLLGIAGGRRRRALRFAAQVCATAVLLLGLLTLGEYLSGADLGIDQRLVREVTQLPGDIPGRMAQNTALSFSALAAALLLLSREKGGTVTAVHVLIAIPLVLGGTALIGYGYDIEEFLRSRLNYTPMSLHAATVFVLLALGAMNARAEFPFRRFVTSTTPAGVMVRMLLPAAIVFVLVTGWLIQQGYHARYFSEIFGLALFAATNIAGLGAMILGIARPLYEAAVQRDRMEASLRENEAELNTIINILPVGLWVLGPDGSVKFSNAAAQRIWTGVRYVDIEHLGEYRGWRMDGAPVTPHDWAGARAVERGETSTEEEIEIECFDGTRKTILDSAVPLRGADGSIRGAVTVNQDISRRKRAEEALRRAAEEIEDLYDRAPCGYHSLDPNGVFVRINHTELEWLGYRRDEVIGKMRAQDMFTPPSRKIFEEAFPTFRELGALHNLELEFMRRDGTVFPVLLNATAIYDQGGRYVMSRSILMDITERKKLERELEHQARKDMLTGLNNRRYFFELAEVELARARRHDEPLSLLMMDVDKFKEVNDTYGHHAGDAALQKFAEMCTRTFREVDFVGRLGGEEFAALLPETDTGRAMEAAERLRRAVEHAAVPLEDGSLLRFTVSIGVARVEASDHKIETALKRADAALYEAKATGRNRVCFGKAA